MLPYLRDRKELGELANLTLAPFVPREELGQSLASSPIHVVPQQPGCADYAVPSKVINALAVGSVVVVAAPAESALARMAHEVPAVRCVRPGDTEAMAEEIVVLARDRRRLAEMRREASGYAAAAFDRNRIVSSIVAAFAD
jgi:colanic acid biosynthesis glycosyl transferase WcaI